MPTDSHAGGYDAEACAKRARHEHPYGPTGRAPRRCTCGNRNWKIKAGGPLPVLVCCTKCSNENKVATAYELGYADALAS